MIFHLYDFFFISRDLERHKQVHSLAAQESNEIKVKENNNKQKFAFKKKIPVPENQ